MMRIYLSFRHENDDEADGQPGDPDGSPPSRSSPRLPALPTARAR